MDSLIIAELETHVARMRLEALYTEQRRAKHPNLNQRLRLMKHRDRLNKLADDWARLTDIAKGL